MGYRIEVRRRHTDDAFHYYHGDDAETRARRDFEGRDLPTDATTLVLIRRDRDGTETVVAERTR